MHVNLMYQRAVAGRKRWREKRQLADPFLTRHNFPQPEASSSAATDPQKHYIFDVPPSSPLHTARFTRNPPVPSTGQPVRIHITHRENGSEEDQEAEVFFVGSAGERIQVHNKDVDPGWIVVLPIEGEYTIHVENLRNVRAGVELFIDGHGEENKRFLGLKPHERKQLTLHTIQTEEEFEIDSTKKDHIPSVPKGFGSIRVKVFEVTDISEEYREYPGASSSGKLGAEKKEATTYLSRTVLPEKHSGVKMIWNTPSPPIQDFSIAYRGEAWAITGGFLPRKYPTTGNGDDDEETLIASPAKRQKIESEEEKRVRGAMETMSYDSSCAEFFQKIAELLDREPSDFDDVLRALKRKRVSNVASLAKISDAQFMTTHLPSVFSSHVKRNLSNLILQHLELIPKPVIRIALDD